MNDKIKVKFDEAGRWSDNPSDPIFEVGEGDVVEVSAALANTVVEAGKGTIFREKVKEESPKKGDECQLSKKKKGVVDENGKCVKKVS